MSIQKFSEFINLDKTLNALIERSEKHNVSVEVLIEVFNRGIVAWSEDVLKIPEQYAFNRVDSFLAGGLASKLDRDLIERKDARSDVEYNVVNTDTKKVIKKHSQLEKGMHHKHHSDDLSVNKTSGDKVVYRRDERGHKIDPDGHVIKESEHYIEARKKLHMAHHESSRQLAGMERDPELRRMDLHRSKKHLHAARILDILNTSRSKK